MLASARAFDPEARDQSAFPHGRIWWVLIYGLNFLVIGLLAFRHPSEAWMIAWYSLFLTIFAYPSWKLTSYYFVKQRRIRKFVALYEDYQAALSIVLSKARQRTGDGHSVTDISQYNFQKEDFENLLCRDDYQLFRRDVLDATETIEQIMKAVEVTDWNTWLWPRVLLRTTVVNGRALTSMPIGQEDKDAQLLNALRKVTAREREFFGFPPSMLLPSFVAKYDSKFAPYFSTRLWWDLDERTASALFSDLETSVAGLKRIVGTVRPIKETLPDFSKTTVVICWSLDPKESSNIEATPNLREPGTFLQHRLWEKVLNKYPRKPVPLDDIRPGGKYRGVCKLQLYFQEGRGPYGGTGWLINDDTVVTAAHCLYDDNFETHAIRVDVLVGLTSQKGTNTQRERRRGASVAVHLGFYIAYDTRHDIAIIKLDRPFTNVSPITPADCPLLMNLPSVTVVGYPGDEPANQQDKGLDMFESTCPISMLSLSSSSFTIQYELDTAGGNSGGPILDVASDGTFKSIGVHCAGPLKVPGKNRGSALGHEGNRLLEFQQALAQAQVSFKGHIKRDRGAENTVRVRIP